MAERGIRCKELDTGCIILYSRQSQNHVESLSVEICSIMTRLGYGEDIRRLRVEMFRENDRLVNALQSNLTRITAGSKAEGLTCFLESDMDTLYVLNGFLCVEAGFNLQTIPDDIDVFRMDTRVHVYPGHCRLLQERLTHRGIDVIQNALCVNGYGDVLLSSSLFLDEWLTFSRSLAKPRRVQHELAGPSIPSCREGVFETDMVFSLRCHCPNILKRWAARPRYWPPPVIVQKVVSLGAYLTPVGFKGSENRNIEWRICFNTGETELVNNLNGTQVKVYVMLKMILKNILKPIKKEISSYVIKNIVLWQAESNHHSMFQERSFFHWLHDGLRQLRTAIEKQHLPYYIIPNRNLMEACGLHKNQQRKWISRT